MNNMSMMFPQSRTARFSRRSIMGMAATVTSASVIAGCSVNTSTDSNTDVVKQAQDAARSIKITFPAPVTSFPDEKVTYRVQSTAGGPNGTMSPVFAAFTNAHSNVTIDSPHSTWESINSTVSLGAQNGSAPDLFSAPNNLEIATMVSDGWFAAFDDIIPDFDNWKKGFPESAFLPGIHVFDGKTYALTLTSNLGQWPAWLYYNKDVFKKLSLDPPSDPFTWSQLRHTAKDITAKGGGNVYGLAFDGQLADSLVLGLAACAGLGGLEMNYKTGMYQYDSPILQGAIELLLSMDSDHSLMPGVMNFNAQQDATHFAQGNVGLSIDGSWNLPTLLQNYPTTNYELLLPPTGDDKVFHHAGYQEGTARPIAAYAKSKYLSISGALLYAMGTVNGQVAMDLQSLGHYISEIPEARKRVAQSGKLPEVVNHAHKAQQELLVQLPLPQVVNPEGVGEVSLQTKPVTPDLLHIIQGALAGKIKNLGKALKKLNDDSNHALDAAIERAQKKGAKVSRDDYVFSNWDPEKDYEIPDYRGRS